MAFVEHAEVLHAIEAKVVSLHAKIRARVDHYDDHGKRVTKVINTTPGRMLLAELLPKHPNVPFSLINRLLTKKEITTVIDSVYRHCGQKETVIFADRMMGIGFAQACKAASPSARTT
jgi:DNA-directed RNA polymerase subunit beta'